MQTIADYILDLSDKRKDRLNQVINYIRITYPNAIESLDYAPNTKIPTFKMGEVYVSIASMKNNITIHFGKYGATDIIAKSCPKITKRVGCVNISDKIDFPIQAIQEAIDYCFNPNDL